VEVLFMDCNEIKDRLPEYLTGLCEEEERTQISKHLSSCRECRSAMEQLEEPIVGQESPAVSLKASKILSKARKALIFRVIALTTASLIVISGTFFMLIPGLLRMARFSQMKNITRALVNITQFTTGSQVVGYGNSLPTFPYYSFKISAFSNEITGVRHKGGRTVEKNFNLITGKFESPAPHLSNFVHPKVTPQELYLKELSPSIAKNMLVKSGENTVARIEVSLKETITLEQAASLTKELDVKLLWLAVECGEEHLQPKNMSSGQNQYVQWGIPGKLFIPNRISSLELNYDNIKEYEQTVIEELKWLDKNKNYISADKNLRRYNGIDNSVGEKARYIIDNGIKVYGLSITGPSTELVKLENTLNIRTAHVTDIDFYYWK
jgi:hypothetical protein